MNVDKIAAFIEQADLAKPRAFALEGRVSLPALTEGSAQGAVVDSNVVTYPEGTPLRVKNFVGSWLLFAQRAASAQVPDKENTSAWVTAYHNVLEQTGWVQRGQAGAWHEEHVEGSTVHQQILEAVTVLLGPVQSALAIVTAALTSLEKMNESSPWITLFDSRGKSATSVGFQFANCNASDDSGAALDAIDFRVEARQTLTQVLFFKFTNERASMYRRRVVFELTPAAMNKYGPAIQARVEDAVLSSIAGFQLANPAG